MQTDRGFRTRNEIVYLGPSPAIGQRTDVHRVSRSTYFESFLLPDSSSLTFECDYILCSDAEDCDGYSCDNSVMHGSGSGSRTQRGRGVHHPVGTPPAHGSGVGPAGTPPAHGSGVGPVGTPPAQGPVVGSPVIQSPLLTPPAQGSGVRPGVKDIRRRKRAIDTYSSANAPTSQRPSAVSTKIQILPQENQYYRISANDLVHGEEPKLTKVSADENANPKYTKHYVPQPTIVREGPSFESTQKMLYGLDLMTIGLIAGLCVLGLLLAVVMTCCLVTICCPRSPLTHSYYHDASVAPLYTGSPIKA